MGARASADWLESSKLTRNLTTRKDPCCRTDERWKKIDGRVESFSDRREDGGVAKSSLSGLSEFGGLEGPCRTPQISADQLTLYQPSWQDYAITVLHTCGLPPDYQTTSYGPVVCLSVCPSVIECIQQEQKTFARATPPPLQSRLGQRRRTVWGHGKLSPPSFDRISIYVPKWFPWF